MPPTRNPSDPRLVTPWSPLGRHARQMEDILAPVPSVLEAYEQLTALASAAGVGLDLRPGTTARAFVDEVLERSQESNEQLRRAVLDLSPRGLPQQELRDGSWGEGMVTRTMRSSAMMGVYQRTYGAPPNQTPSPLSMGTQSWSMNELPGVFASNRDAIRQVETNAPGPYDLEVEGEVFTSLTLAALGFDGQHAVDPYQTAYQEYRSRFEEPPVPEPPKIHIFWPTSWERLMEESGL